MGGKSATMKQQTIRTVLTWQLMINVFKTTQMIVDGGVIF